MGFNPVINSVTNELPVGDNRGWPVTEFYPVIKLVRNKRPFGSRLLCESVQLIIALTLKFQNLITYLDELMIIIRQGRLSIRRVGY